ncbi:hypothetical protein DFS34DRAFT_40809 [Phlyctochytrium arcticum]|nr:hypothetical protein DFS34DRAFT_40809 [Phlyctochytrium arcticum]
MGRTPTFPTGYRDHTTTTPQAQAQAQSQHPAARNMPSTASFPSPRFLQKFRRKQCKTHPAADDDQQQQQNKAGSYKLSVPGSSTTTTTTTSSSRRRPEQHESVTPYLQFTFISDPTPKYYSEHNALVADLLPPSYHVVTEQQHSFQVVANLPTGASPRETLQVCVYDDLREIALPGSEGQMGLRLRLPETANLKDVRAMVCHGTLTITVGKVPQH